MVNSNGEWFSGIKPANNGNLNNKKNVVEWACIGHVLGYNGDNLGDM